MKKISLISLIVCVLSGTAFGAGRSMAGAGATGGGAPQNSARMAVVPVNQAKATVASVQEQPGQVVQTVQETQDVAVVEQEKEQLKAAVVAEKTQAAKVVKDAREQERKACLGNNVGIGNTFVWASRNSNTANYAGMVEDMENPENNVCFVLVGMRSDDPRISTADIQPRYFEWGQNITCGSWADENKMEERILNAKKSARTWGTIGGVVGGAGIGVGAMELFGNKLIGGAVQGQKQYDEYSAQWYNAKANELKQADEAQYNNFMRLAKRLVEECSAPDKDKRCDEPKYKGIQEFYSSNK